MNLFPDTDGTKPLSHSVLMEPSYEVQLCTVTIVLASQKY